MPLATYHAALLADTDPDTAVQSGRDALGPSGKFPWYDAERDDLRPVDLHVDDDSSDDPSHDQSRNGNDRSGGDSTRNGSGYGSGNGSGGGSRTGSGSPRGSRPSAPIDPSAVTAPALMWIAWIAIAGVLLWIVYMLIRAFLDREAKNAKQSNSSQDAADEEVDGARLDALPTRVGTAKGGLLDEARRHYEAGNYNAAVIFLYSYQLLKLDQNQMLRLAKGKTNREYLRELANRPELYGILAQTLVPFEDVFFGEHQLPRERFKACWNQVDRFNRLIDQAAT